jgi:hypothetical protein
MNIYKITNITNTAGKRDLRFNSTLDIEYVENMITKIIKIKPGETTYLNIPILPISVHKLRVSKLISVVEISESEQSNIMNVGKPVVKNTVVADEKTNANSIEKKKISKKINDDKSE